MCLQSGEFAGVGGGRTRMECWNRLITIVLASLGGVLLVATDPVSAHDTTVLHRGDKQGVGWGGGGGHGGHGPPLFFWLAYITNNPLHNTY